MRTLNEYIEQIRPLIRTNNSGSVEDDDIKQALNRAIRKLINQYGIYATKNQSVLAVYPSVYEYPVAADFHDIINLQTPGNPRDYTRMNPDEFKKRLRERDNILAIDTIKGQRFLLLKSSSSGDSVVVNGCDDLTVNGTWAAQASTDAANLSDETVNTKDGSAIRFDLDVSLSANNYAAIDNDDMDEVDLSTYENTSTFFAWLFIPDATYVTGCTLGWGSSSSAYWSQSVTAQYNGLPLRTGWNRLGFAWRGATQTGSPDESAVDFVSFRVTYGASQGDLAGFVLDDIRCENPEYMEADYYSSHFVQTAAGVSQRVFDAGDDETLLADEDDDVLMFPALSDAALIRETLADIEYFELRFKELMPALKGRYMSERKKETRRYY